MSRPYNVQRNSGQGPSYNSFDLKVMKAFVLTKDNAQRLMFEMDSSNLFNRENYSDVYNYFPNSVDTVDSTGAVLPAGSFGPKTR